MTGPVLAKTYPAPSVDRKEILRYMGCHCGRADEARKTDSALESMIDECLAELLPQLTYNVCYRQFTIYVDACNCNLSFMQTDSRALAGALDGCERLVVFAATIGLAPDRLISKYGRLSPARALCFQAIGAERIESLCASFNDDISFLLQQEGFFTRPRFSPGYGDFPLAAQKDIFRVLDCERRIGLSLNDSLLMSPSKSVTALIGAAAGEKPGCDRNAQNSCRTCDDRDCPFRR